MVFFQMGFLFGPRLCALQTARCETSDGFGRVVFAADYWQRETSVLAQRLDWIVRDSLPRSSLDYYVRGHEKYA